MESCVEDGSPAESPRLIYDLTRDDVSALCAAMGQPAYRAAQLWHWLYVRRVDDWKAMSNLPGALLRPLAERFSLQPGPVLDVRGDPARTRKLVIGLIDGECVESVFIPAGRSRPAERGPETPEQAARRTVCVSSQVGCRYRCAFCASGQAGFRRDLTAGEMIAQVLLCERIGGSAPTHVVFMGIGEPLDNYDRVLGAVRTLNHAEGMNIGARRITISTCGIVPGIERLAGEGLQVELSVSLHAATDALRSQLVPANQRFPLADVLNACRRYAARTRRLITFEYTLIKGLNDSESQADELVRLLAGMLCRVNLIPLSPVAEFDGEASPPDRAALFVERLADAHINATLRASRGASVEAACGQLRLDRARRQCTAPEGAS